MTLAELGAKLREAREARDLTVADAADWLKIPTRILEGVEEGAEHLPRTVYVYHFIKDYAKYLGFSAEEAGSWISSVEGFENVSRPVITESVPFTPVKPSMLPVVLGGLLKLAVLAALAFGAYSAYVHFFAGRDYEEIIAVPPAQEQAAPATPAAPAWEPAAPASPLEQEPAKSAPAAPAQEKSEKAEAVPSAEAVSAAPQWDAPAAQEAPAEPAVVQAQEPETAPAAPVAQPFAPVAQPAAEPAEAAPAVEAAQNAPVSAPALPAHVSGHVEVIADAGDCWMGFEVDGRKQQRFLRKGGSFTMSFRDALELKLGDAGAVRVLYNGRELERAAAGRVLTLRFPPSE